MGSTNIKCQFFQFINVMQFWLISQEIERQVERDIEVEMEIDIEERGKKWIKLQEWGIKIGSKIHKWREPFSW